MIMKSLLAFLQRHSFGVGVFLSVVVFVTACFGLVVANGETVGPTDAHLVKLYVDGQERSLVTRAATIKELLDKQQVELRREDLVEPTADTEIAADNLRVHVTHATPVTIIDDGLKSTIWSAHDDPRLAVADAGIVLHPEDTVQQDFVQDVLGEAIIGRKLTIYRSKLIHLVIYGQAVDHRTQAQTVADLLAEMKLKPAVDDTVQPAVSEHLSDGLAVYLTRFGTKVETVEESIPYTTETTTDDSLSSGAQKILQEGITGKKLVAYEINLANGQEISRRAIQETVTLQPVVKKVVRGTKPLFADYNADGIPARVYCGSPRQGNWKNIVVANAAAGRSLAAERGWTGGEWDALLELFACESSWNEHAGNPYSGAYGIPQAWPAEKMSAYGSDYMTNPVTQLKWGLNYIASRYGSPSAALAFHYRNNYY